MAGTAKMPDGILSRCPALGKGETSAEALYFGRWSKGEAMNLFGANKATKGTVEEVAHMVASYFKGRGLDVATHQLAGAEGVGWWLQEGSAKVYVYVQDTQMGPVIRVTSPINNIPATNREAFYRKLLDINGNLSSCSLATHENSVLVVAQRATNNLDQSELDDLIWNVAYVADLLDNKLATEFGAPLYT